MVTRRPKNTLKKQEAYEFYKEIIFKEARFTLLRKYKLRIAGSVPSRDWELFIAILIDRLGKGGYGCDLQECEIKSAVDGKSFEYQYHFKTGEAKLDEDKVVDHFYISYSGDYKNITVRRIPREALANEFESWREGLKANYSGKNRKQRYRKDIGYNKVLELGTIIMSIVDGKLYD